MKKASERQQRYDSTHTRRFGLKLNTATDADIIARMENAEEGIQGYIKRLIREDIDKNH